MSNLTGEWIGTLYGTNHGNAFMELEDADGRLTGSIRFNEPGVGVLVYSVDGTPGDRISLNLQPQQAPNGVQLESGNATAILQPDGSLTGRWETELGTAGTFRLYPQNALQRVERGQAKQPSVPEQVFFHTVSIGAVRLYRSDLRKLFETIGRDFIQGQPIVTYVEHDVQVTKFATAFLEAPPVEPLKSLKVSIQEPEPTGLVKLVNVDLVGGAGSQVRTSATNESWVIGKAQNIRAAIATHENKLVSWYRRFGLIINIFVFLLLLIAVPEIVNWRQRAGFVGVLYGLMAVLTLIYNRFVPNTLVFASARTPSWWARAWPTILSWLVAVTSSLVAMWVFWYFTKS